LEEKKTEFHHEKKHKALGKLRYEARHLKEALMLMHLLRSSCVDNNLQPSVTTASAVTAIAALP